jgi:hypothetical protein
MPENQRTHPTTARDGYGRTTEPVVEASAGGDSSLTAYTRVDEEKVGSA